MNLSKLWETVEDRSLLQSMGSQRVGHDLVTDQQQQHLGTWRKSTDKLRKIQLVGPLIVHSRIPHSNNSPLAVWKILACIMTEEEYYSIQFYSRRMDPCYLRTHVTCNPNSQHTKYPRRHTYWNLPPDIESLKSVSLLPWDTKQEVSIPGGKGNLGFKNALCTWPVKGTGSRHLAPRLPYPILCLNQKTQENRHVSKCHGLSHDSVGFTEIWTSEPLELKAKPKAAPSFLPWGGSPGSENAWCQVPEAWRL